MLPNRTWLCIPFEEKDRAKALGASWDAMYRGWYLPAGLDPTPFAAWLDLPTDDQPRVRTPFYFLATASRNCWKCHASTDVVATLVPEPMSRPMNVYLLDT